MKMPFTMSLSMTLGDFLRVVQQNGYAALARPAKPPDPSASHERRTESESATNHFLWSWRDPSRSPCLRSRGTAEGGQRR
jgi:hypothetical protein